MAWGPLKRLRLPWASRVSRACFLCLFFFGCV